MIGYMKNWAGEKDLRFYRGARWTDRQMAGSDLKYIQASSTATLIHDVLDGIPTISKSILGKGYLTFHELVSLLVPPACLRVWGRAIYEPLTHLMNAISVHTTVEPRYAAHQSTSR
jgi:hypothetical protein